MPSKLLLYLATLTIPGGIMYVGYAHIYAR